MGRNNYEQKKELNYRYYIIEKEKTYFSRI